VPEDRLNYLSRDITTVQRWEKREGMPVHRHLHDKIGSIHAFRSELDAWAATRKIRAAPDSPEPVVPPDPPESTGASAPAVQPAPPKRARLIAALLGLTLLAAVAGFWWLRKTEYFWKSPIADARFQTLTDFDGVEQGAAISRDGRFVAFLSDRDGQMDVWLTQVGSGQFHNLTRGSIADLTNPSIRNLGFSPDGSQVAFWVGRQGNAGGEIGIWAVPTLGGTPKPYLEGAAEFDWSRDGSRLAYHTPGPGDPLFISDGRRRPDEQPVFTAPSGNHAHFPLWSPDNAFLYFVQGSLPDKLDIWRLNTATGNTERITSHAGRVSHPALIDHRTLVYLATDSDGSGPWLYSTDVEHRIPHRLTAGLDQYTSLAATADGRRLVATLASPKRTLWRLPIGQANDANPKPIVLPTSTGFAPRFGPDYFLYVAASGTGDAIWKIQNGKSTELWAGRDARLTSAPAILAGVPLIAFAVRQHTQKALYVMQTDGTGLRLISDSLNLQGGLAWAPDGESITAAADDHGVPRLLRIPVNGGTPSRMVQEYSLDPTWAPNGRYLVYSGADIGTTFTVKAVSRDAAVHSLPSITLTRGARRLAFLPAGRAMVVLRGELQHKNLWQIDLESGAEKRLTDLPRDFDIRDFDVSSDGTEVIIERVQQRSDVILIDLAKR
jgi:Tol biopolymer transport system component